jgi:hypothetical protein
VFEYVPPVDAFFAVPSAGPREGGTVVTVVGAGFVGGEGVECAFGGVTSPADVVSSSLLRCVSPPHTPVVGAIGDVTLDAIVGIVGDVLLDVIVSGASRRVALPFAYHDALDVTGTAGVCTEGTRGWVDVLGVGFLEGRALWCVFGDVTDGVSNTFRGTLVASGTLRCQCPSGPPGNVSVGVTADMHTVAYAPHAMEVTGAPVVRAVQPSIAPVSGKP